MRYVQLRAFHYVAISGGFSRAGELLHLTQPAISDQVRKLEAEYDLRLFNRGKKQITLTPSGERLLEITRRMFEMEEQASEYLSQSRSIKSGRLNMVVDSVHHIAGILEPFRKKYPEIFISVQGGNTDAVIQRLNNYEADIGVLGDVPTGREFEIISLTTTPIVAFAAAGSEIGQRQSITFRELANQSLILREPGSKTRSKFEKFAKDNNVKLSIGIEAEGREAVREIVMSGTGVGIVSEAEFSNYGQLVKVPISDAAINMDEALVCLKERKESRLIRTFMSFASQVT